MSRALRRAERNLQMRVLDFGMQDDLGAAYSRRGVTRGPGVKTGDARSIPLHRRLRLNSVSSGWTPES
jgi:hypothetical protein